MDGFKETEIGLIPQEWDIETIGDIFDIQQGKQLSKQNRVGDDQKKFLRTANVFWSSLEITELDQMNFTTKEQEKLRLKYNDLLVCEGG